MATNLVEANGQRRYKEKYAASNRIYDNAFEGQVHTCIRTILK